MRQAAGLVTLIVAVVLAGCQGSREDSGTGPSPLHATLPVGALPYGGIVPSPSPSPSPSPGQPNPSPTPEPEETPDPNANPVTKVGIKVMFVVCGGQGVPDSELMTRIPLGCNAWLDLTPKDANNKPTDARSEPEWHYSDPGMVAVKDDPYTPRLTAKEEGVLSVWAFVDGVRSNTLELTFY